VARLLLEGGEDLAGGGPGYAELLHHARDARHSIARSKLSGADASADDLGHLLMWRDRGVVVDAHKITVGDQGCEPGILRNNQSVAVSADNGVELNALWAGPVFRRVHERPEAVADGDPARLAEDLDRGADGISRVSGLGYEVDFGGKAPANRISAIENPLADQLR
jgi:hypothetical protein